MHEAHKSVAFPEQYVLEPIVDDAEEADTSEPLLIESEPHRDPHDHDDPQLSPPKANVEVTVKVEESTKVAEKVNVDTVVKVEEVKIQETKPEKVEEVKTPEVKKRKSGRYYSCEHNSYSKRRSSNKRDRKSR